jgi:hypothetical protein
MVSVPQLMLLAYQHERSTGGASCFAPVVSGAYSKKQSPGSPFKALAPDVIKEIRRLRTELPNLGKEQILSG